MASAAQARDPRAQPAEILPEQARERFADVVEDYVRLHVNVHLKASTATGYRNHLRRLSERWASKRITAVSRRDVLDVLDEHTANANLAQARLVYAIVSAFFAWCVERGLLTHSPIEGLRSPARVAPRDRVLSDAELSVLWAASGALGYPYGAFFRLLLLTGQREGEVARIQREHVREQIWQIPDTKRGTPHRITLPKLADAELEAMPIFVEGPFLFTSTAGKKPINGFSKAKVRLDASAAALQMVAPQHFAALEPWRIHDLRRTAASGMARLGVSPHVIEAVLNHRSGHVSGIARVYNVYNYAEEIADALARWSAHIEALAGAVKAVSTSLGAR